MVGGREVEELEISEVGGGSMAKPWLVTARRCRGE
jgi:hypothetical protein